MAKFEKIGRELAEREWKLSARGERWEMFTVTVSRGAEDPWKASPVAIEMSQGSGVGTRGFSFVVDGVTFATIERPDQDPQDRLNLDQNWFGNDSPENRLRFARAAGAIGAEFTIARTLPQFVSSTGELAKFVEARDQGLARLEELYTRFTRELVEDRKRNEAELAEEKRKLEQQAAQLREQLDAERKADRAVLENERGTLAARLKEIDDRAATFARRQIRADLKNEFKNRQTQFGVTRDTQRKRWPVAAAVLTLAVLFGWGFIFYAYEFITNPPTGNTLYVAMARQVLLGIGFAGAVWYFIHWQNSWFQRHADEEFKLKRLELDFDRASWVVELAMEWSKEKTGQEIPESVLRELTRGLFGDAGSGLPAAKKDVFSALLDASTKAEIAVGGSKFSLNHKGGKKLKDALTDDE